MYVVIDMNNSGPSMDPCGTPMLSFLQIWLDAKLNLQAF